ncbi:hypothetical protein HYH03_013626 [Edaphochlamys debaryana]|uniref:Uncharacterized protein n=1 Tax=Edaphochlamys debaryana TaxID=47281 RepID=A0A836BT63_9CHLO|nr:hypothetical protein HYH03_013626 [Edaphochlamys debaryana]|eukprot:KAG2487782.1 hypothetical protein HYH03_013626 [Edaphochlamys debaryana]
MQQRTSSPEGSLAPPSMDALVAQCPAPRSASGSPALFLAPRTPGAPSHAPGAASAALFGAPRVRRASLPADASSVFSTPAAPAIPCHSPGAGGPTTPDRPADRPRLPASPASPRLLSFGLASSPRPSRPAYGRGTSSGCLLPPPPVEISATAVAQPASSPHPSAAQAPSSAGTPPSASSQQPCRRDLQPQPSLPIVAEDGVPLLESLTSSLSVFGPAAAAAAAAALAVPPASSSTSTAAASAVAASPASAVTVTPKPAAHRSAAAEASRFGIRGVLCPRPSLDLVSSPDVPQVADLSSSLSVFGPAAAAAAAATAVAVAAQSARPAIATARATSRRSAAEEASPFGIRGVVCNRPSLPLVTGPSTPHADSLPCSLSAFGPAAAAAAAAVPALSSSSAAATAAAATAALAAQRSTLPGCLALPSLAAADCCRLAALAADSSRALLSRLDPTTNATCTTAAASAGYGPAATSSSSAEGSSASCCSGSGSGGSIDCCGSVCSCRRSLLGSCGGSCGGGSSGGSFWVTEREAEEAGYGGVLPGGCGLGLVVAWLAAAEAACGRG